LFVPQTCMTSVLSASRPFTYRCPLKLRSSLTSITALPDILRAQAFVRKLLFLCLSTQVLTKQPSKIIMYLLTDNFVDLQLLPS
jgi:hypothetical protein